MREVRILSSKCTWGDKHRSREGKLVLDKKKNKNMKLIFGRFLKIIIGSSFFICNSSEESSSFKTSFILKQYCTYPFFLICCLSFLPFLCISLCMYSNIITWYSLSPSLHVELFNSRFVMFIIVLWIQCVAFQPSICKEMVLLSHWTVGRSIIFFPEIKRYNFRWILHLNKSLRNSFVWKYSVFVIWTIHLCLLWRYRADACIASESFMI